jgi:eukaryotic-like serine/threonine-protein kinase
MKLTAGLVIAERFRLVRPLGQGGMGAVWLAQHTGLDVPCAVKFIHEEAARSPELRARFEREAKAAAQLRSPHVVQILDHGVWSGVPYMAMEYLEGEDLGERLQRVGRLDPREALTVAAQVGRALSKAHAAGLIHRDLKPSNIFIGRDDEREVAKVLDFGVAKVKETGVDGSTKTGAILGTPYYMSPEQARGSKSVDHRSDLWALAVVVYQCVTGRLPFPGEALGDLFVKIIVEPLPVPSHAGPVPPGFDAWWARAAARDPAQRFQTAKELIDALGVSLGVSVPGGLDMGISSPGIGFPVADAPPSVARSRDLNAPLVQSQGGTIAMPVSSPGLLAASAPPHLHGGQATPVPGAQTSAAHDGGRPQTFDVPAPSNVAVATSQVTSGPIVLTPVPQTGSLDASPRPSRGGVIVAAVVGALALGGAAAFFVLRGGPPTPTAPAGAATIAAASKPAAIPTNAAPQPPPPPSASPSVQPNPAADSTVAPPAASASAARGTPRVPTTGRPGKAKTDFGF